MSRVIVKDLPKNLKAEDLKEHFAIIDTVTENSLRFTDSGVFRRFAFVGFKNQDSGAKAVEKLNNTYIGMSKIKVELAKNWQETKSNPSATKKKCFKGDKTKSNYRNNDAPSEDLILQTGRLFLRNLPYDCSAEDIEALFSKYGKNEVHLVVNRILKTSIGTCFVNFSVPEEAMKAFKELDGIDFQGRLLHIIPAHPKQETPGEAGAWKKKKEETKKPKAHKWNTLFVSSNATADVIAERLKISKSDLLLKPGNSSVAARIAVGESQIVSEIKEFLLENGVALDSFGQADGPRSKTVILVKHLNAFTTADSLRTIFERYGTIVRLVLPPCGMSALVEFAEPSKAKFAFEKLDMTTVDHMIMYLEWAPMNVFSKPAPAEGENTNEEKLEDGDTKTSKLSADYKKEAEQKKKKQQIKSTKFIIKNVDFRATRKDISLLFKAYQGLESVRLPKKLPGSGPEKHRGFAFVEFLTAEQAEAAFKDLCQDTHLYKRRLVFEWTAGDENVTLLRKRTADHYAGDSKKFKKNDLISELGTNP